MEKGGSFFYFSHRGHLKGPEMHFRRRKQRLGSVTCFAAMTFSHKGRSLLFCKSIIGCPLSTANFFFFFLKNSAFRSIILHLSPFLLFVWDDGGRQSFGRKRCRTSADWKSGPKICSRRVFNLKPFMLSAKMFDLAANDILATPTVFAYVEHA